MAATAQALTLPSEICFCARLSISQSLSLLSLRSPKVLSLPATSLQSQAVALGPMKEPFEGLWEAQKLSLEYKEAS
jgi:hypothetical protein